MRFASSEPALTVLSVLLLLVCVLTERWVKQVKHSVWASEERRGQGKRQEGREKGKRKAREMPSLKQGLFLPLFVSISASLAPAEKWKGWGRNQIKAEYAYSHPYREKERRLRRHIITDGANEWKENTGNSSWEMKRVWEKRVNEQQGRQAKGKREREREKSKTQRRQTKWHCLKDGKCEWEKERESEIEVSTMNESQGFLRFHWSEKWCKQ